MIRLRYIALFLLLCLGAVAAAGLWLSVTLQAPGPLAAEKIFYIEPGSSVKKIAAELRDSGIIENPLAFSLGARLQRGGGGLKAGEYQFPARVTANEVIALLQSGKTYQRQITIPEGLMVSEVLALVAGAEAMTGQVTDIPEEGSLLPETYSYSHGDSRAALVARMKKAMDDAVASLWQQKPEDSVLKSEHDLVTLASVVEKETGVPQERPRVAGVFVNRLRAGMPLQSDPTVIYAVTQGKEKLDRPLSRKDLNMDSPYNTYLVPGLPPGPIANPGRAALEAALRPEQNNYLYFVADGTGGHAFAATLDEHTRNVGNWRRLEREKTP
jgi:UPF0755 protein